MKRWKAWKFFNLGKSTRPIRNSLSDSFQDLTLTLLYLDTICKICSKFFPPLFSTHERPSTLTEQEKKNDREHSEYFLAKKLT